MWARGRNAPFRQCEAWWTGFNSYPANITYTKSTLRWSREETRKSPRSSSSVSVAIKPVVVSAPATSPCGLVLPQDPSLTTLYTPALGKHRYSDTRPAPAILEVSFFGPCPPLCLQRKVCRGERVLASPIEWARRREGDRKRSFETRYLASRRKHGRTESAPAVGKWTSDLVVDDSDITQPPWGPSLEGK